MSELWRVTECPGRQNYFCDGGYFRRQSCLRFIARLGIQRLRCDEKVRLLVAWNKAFDTYKRASVELAEAAGRIAYAEFEFLANRVRKARQAFLETAEQLN